MEINLEDLKERPESILPVIDKYVKVQLIKDVSFEGFIQSIDPLSHSIILSALINGVQQTVLIPGHAVISITESTPPINMKPLIRKASQISVEDISKKKIRVVEWLKKNLLPVSECDDKIILGNVSVLPPYRTVDICTDNAVVALQIRRIIENMPDDFEPNTNE